MQIQFLGQSAFLLEHDGHKVLIDPFLQGPTSPVSVEEALAWKVDAVLLSHGHSDHFGSALEFGKAGVPIIAMVEVAAYAESNGAKDTVGANIGGTVQADWGKVKFTPAFHSNALPDGSYGGMPAGLVVEMGAIRLYHAGDTCAFSDMELIGNMGLDAALLPIGDHFTMGPEEAARCLKWLRPRVAVPMHYGTFPPLVGDPEVFARLGREGGVDVQIMQPGDTLKLEAQG